MCWTTCSLLLTSRFAAASFTLACFPLPVTIAKNSDTAEDHVNADNAKANRPWLSPTGADSMPFILAPNSVAVMGLGNP